MGLVAGSVDNVAVGPVDGRFNAAKHNRSPRLILDLLYKKAGDWSYSIS